MADLHRCVTQVTYGTGVNVAFLTQLITKSSEANWRELTRFYIEASTKVLLMSLPEYLFLMKGLSLIIKVESLLNISRHVHLLHKVHNKALKYDVISLEADKLMELPCRSRYVRVY
jgi:hypothetical protein